MLKRRRSPSPLPSPLPLPSSPPAEASVYRVLATPALLALLPCGDVRALRSACREMRAEISAPSAHAAECFCLTADAWACAGFMGPPSSLKAAARALLKARPIDCCVSDVYFLERAAAETRHAFVDMAAWMRWCRGTPHRGGAFASGSGTGARPAWEPYAWRYVLARVALLEGWPAETLLHVESVRGAALLGAAALHELRCNATAMRAFARAPKNPESDAEAALHVHALAAMPLAPAAHVLEHHAFAWALALGSLSRFNSRPPAPGPRLGLAHNLIDTWDTGLPVGAIWLPLPSAAPLPAPPTAEALAASAISCTSSSSSTRRTVARGMAWARSVELWKSSERALRSALQHFGAIALPPRDISPAWFAWLARERCARALRLHPPGLTLFAACSRKSVDRLVRACEELDDDAPRRTRAALYAAAFPALSVPPQQSTVRLCGFLALLSHLGARGLALPPLCECSRVHSHSHSRAPHALSWRSVHTCAFSPCVARLGVVFRVASSLHECRGQCGEACAEHARDAPIRAVLCDALRAARITPYDVAFAEGTRVCSRRGRALLRLAATAPALPSVTAPALPSATWTL